MKKLGRCKLCNQDQVQLVKGHIVPDFLYQRIRAKGLLKTYVQSNPKAKNFGQFTYDKPGTGWYDYMFCNNCDCIILKQYEDYTAPILKHLFALDPKHFPNGLVPGQNIDYAPFKRFFLAIIYKTAMHTRPDIPHLDLKPKYCEEIRKYLLDPKLEIPEEYCPILLYWVPKDETISEVIKLPYYHYDENLKDYVCIFMMGEIMMYCPITATRAPLAVVKNSIQKAGTLFVTIHNGPFAQKTYDHMLAHLANTQRKLTDPSV